VPREDSVKSVVILGGARFPPLQRTQGWGIFCRGGIGKSSGPRGDSGRDSRFLRRRCVWISNDWNL